MSDEKQREKVRFFKMGRMILLRDWTTIAKWNWEHSKRDSEQEEGHI